MSDEIKKEENSVIEEKKEVAVSKQNKLVADFSNGIYGSSDSFTLAFQMAKGLSQSTIVPQQFQNNPSNCLIAIEQAQRLNMSPMQVMQNLYVIQGRPSWSSSFLIAMINSSHIFDIELQYEEEEKDGKPYSCLVWTEKDGRRINGMKVTMDMADKEGWTKKNGSKWNTLPALMLRYRAVSFFARLQCPEISLGMYTQEEMYDNDFSNTQKKSKASLNDILADDDADVIVGEVVE
jgi:exonuclease I